MTIIELEAELREFYTTNKDLKGGGFGIRLIEQYINHLDLSLKLKLSIETLEDCIYSLEYAAFNINEAKIGDLPDNIVESTSASETALISARNAKQLINSIKI